jgi:beta-mannanase
MITPLSTSGKFWSTGKRNNRRTALGATTIVVLLALISWLVWMSPTDSPIRKAVSDVVQPISTNMQLKSDRANLLGQLVSTKSTITNQSAELASQKEQLAAAVGKAKALETQLATAKSQMAQAKGQASSYKSQAATGSGSSPSNTLATGPGSSTDASSTTAGSGTSTVTPPDGSTTPTGSGTAPTGPTPVVTPTLAEIKDPTSRYFGLYTAQSPFSFSEFNQVAADVNAQPNVSAYFQGWDKDFRPDAVQASWAKGDLPMMTWESQSSTASNNATIQPDYSLGNIISGKFDSYLKQYADDIVANGQPMAIRLDQEMNASWYPWSEGANGNTAGQFKTMWQHVHDIFQAEGANSYVIWDWSPNRVDNLSSSTKTQAYMDSLYPGDAYVDWVGMSGYERPNGQGVQQDGSFNATFGTTLKYLRAIAPHKKIILSEIGAAEEGPAATDDTPSLKQKWITSLFDALADPANSDIIGFNWFNLTVTTNVNKELASNDWRIGSTGASLATFATEITRTDTGFSLRPPPAQ